MLKVLILPNLCKIIFIFEWCSGMDVLLVRTTFMVFKMELSQIKQVLLCQNAFTVKTFRKLCVLAKFKVMVGFAANSITAKLTPALWKFRFVLNATKNNR